MYRHPLRNNFVAVVALLVTLALAAGCESEAAAGGSKSDRAKAEQEQEQAASAVEVSAEGEKFEPSIPVEKVPSGAWHCNMNGKVHYAAMEKGDGRCPVCNMKLKKAE